MVLRITTYFVLSLALSIIVGREAEAQCPGGKPALPGGKCPAPPRPPAAPPSYCSIMIQVDKRGGGRTDSVNLSLNGQRNENWKTDRSGNYTLRGLLCGRRYEIKPANASLTFDPPSSTVAKLKGQAKISFIAIAPEKPAPAAPPLPPPPPPPCNPPPSKLQSVTFGDSLSDNVSPQVSGCDRETGMLYFNDYRLKGAVGGDTVNIEIRSAQTKELKVQVFGKGPQPLESEAINENEDLQTSRIVLPELDDYKIRVSTTRDSQSAYQLMVSRKGLTSKGYENQIQLAGSALNVVGISNLPNFYDALNYNLARLRDEIDYETREAADQRVKKATEILERLTRIVPDRADAHEMLSVIYLYHRKDPRAAANQRELALNLKGTIRFRVRIGDNFPTDKRWRRSDKRGERVEGNLEDCWLLIQDGKMVCESFVKENGEVFTAFSGIRDKSKLIDRKSDLTLKIFGTRKYLIGTRKYFRRKANDENKFETKEREQFLMPLSGNKDESAIIQDLIVRFVQSRS